MMGYTFTFRNGYFQMITINEIMICYNFHNIYAKKGWNEHTNKVTPEQLEQAVKTVIRDHHIEYIHKDLYFQIEYIASQWSGASSDRFYQMFNEAKPKMFNICKN